MNYKKIIPLLAMTLTMAGACVKSDETFHISQATYHSGQVVSDATPLSGSIKGIMLTGKTYTMSGDVTINAGDTLLLQQGVTIYVAPHSNIIVKGSLISLGTKTQPNYITAKGMTKTDTPGQDINTDQAYAGYWGGIDGDTSCALMVFKWTHIEYTGAAFVNPPVYGTVAGSKAWTVLFQNAGGVLDFEDCWVYGTTVDVLRVNAGKVNIMRNTFEKIGKSGAEGVNIKGPTVGDVAYNLLMGCGQNGIKASNIGGTTIQCNINAYNNTILNSGWKTTQTGRGASINYEQGARGNVYNNIIVNCKYGFRVVKTPPADTVNLFYGYNLYYGDADSVVNQFYPVSYISKPQHTDIPDPVTYLPAGYTLGQAYNAPSIVGADNPYFVKYTLPAQGKFSDISYASGFDFRLLTSSPAIGKGFTGFAPLATVHIDPTYGATEITPPGKDIGAYLSNGIGNQH